MASLLTPGRRNLFRSSVADVPDRPAAVPYELRTEMTWLDFSNPANPLGTPKSIIQAMHTALVDGELSYTPDRDGTAFRESISAYHGLDSDWVLAGGSVTQMITAAATAFRPCTVGIATPAPIDYITAVVNAGHQFVDLHNDISFATVDPYTARNAVGVFEGALLANPSFPGSRLLEPSMLTQYLETCKWVIVDESYIELCFGGESVIPLCQRYRNLIVVRTTSATFCMPGTPVSYLVAQPDTLAAIAQFYDGSGISMFAEVLAKTFTAQGDYIEQTHEYLEKEIPWMQCMLSLLPGINIYPAEGNFVLCVIDPNDGMRLGISGAEELVVRLQLAGYLVHRLDNIYGLDNKMCFCISVRSHDDNEALLETMRRVLTTRG